MEQLISGADWDDDLEAPPDHGRYIILTSGTTGTPKGAQRGQARGLSSLAALLSKIPRRHGETTMIAAPLFHSWGFLHFILSLPTVATMVSGHTSTPRTHCVPPPSTAPACSPSCR